MWALLKADFAYTRLGLCVIGLIVAFFFVQHAKMDDWAFYSFVNNTAVVVMIGMGIMAGSVDKERRDRAFMQLPVSIFTVGMARLVYVPIVFAALMIVWSVYLLVRPQGGSVSDFWIMCNATAVGVIAFIVFAVNHDLGYYESKRYRILLFGGLVAFAGMLVIVGLLGELRTWVDNYFGFFASAAGVLVHAIAAGLALLFEVRIFEGRRSYLS